MSSFCTAKATHIFSAKNFSIFAYLDVNFNESLTNDIVSFEQLGPEFTFLIWTSTLFQIDRGLVKEEYFMIILGLFFLFLKNKYICAIH